MEQKELNLCEILRGHEGEDFYSPCYGNVKLTDVYVENIMVRSIIGEKKHTLTDKGIHPNGGEPMLYPSKELRESYTFEGAWQKWAEENCIVTYEEIVKLLAKKFWCGIENINCTSKKQLDKLYAINKLMNVQKYLEKGWQPDWEDINMRKCFIYINKDNEIRTDVSFLLTCGDIYFSSYENAQKAIEILGEDVIRQALSTDW